MLRKALVYLTTLCLLLTLAACGKPQGGIDRDTTRSTTSPQKPADTQEPLTPALAPTFAAMPQMAQEFAQVYRLGDTVALFAFITPGMDASRFELVCYDMAADAVLGTLNLGEKSMSLFPLDGNSFAVLDYNSKAYTVYDTACAVQSSVTLAFDSLIGSADKNGDRLLLSNVFGGEYYIYDLKTQGKTPVDTAVDMVNYTCVGNHKDAFLLHSYTDGLIAVTADGKKQIVSTSATGVQVAGTTYAAGVVGDYAVFHSLLGGDAVMAPVRGEAEMFCSADGNGILSHSQSEQGALYYYDLNRRTVTDHAVNGMVVDAALSATSAVAVVRTAFGQPLTFTYVELASLAAKSMDAAAYDQAVIDDLRPLPTVEGTAATIKETYGVTVIGEHDFFDVSPYGYAITAATAAQIASRTELLKDFLAFFPQGLFQEMSQKAPVVIVLCGDVGGTAGGMNTLIDGYNVTFLSVTGTDDYFCGVAAHELGHAMERGVSLADLDGWMAMQPAAVQAAYGNLNLTVEYTADDKGKTPVWFTDVYGRTNAMEDRATVFEEMYTAYVSGDTSTLNYDGLKQKVAYWSRMLRNNYACCKDAAFAWDGLFE
ncbi:MAG: hypothetical protein IKL13_04535 [Clostridia bacterium]|nr:hypothetical protein [Clostridia bacterium]